MRTRAYRYRRNTPAFPAQWLYDLYVVVLVTGFLATIVSGLLRQLDASTGASNPHDFTVRNSPFVLRATASTATCPTSATMANAPLVGQDGGSHKDDLPDATTGIFFREGLDRLLGDLGDLPVVPICRMANRVVIAGRAQREPGIHTPDRGYGFRARDFVAPRNDRDVIAR